MTAPLSRLVEAASATDAPPEIDVDRRTAMQECKNLYQAVGQFVESQAAKARKHGRTAFVAGMDAELGAAYLQLLGMLQQIYPAMSDMPFPEFPDEAVTEEVPS